MKDQEKQDIVAKEVDGNAIDALSAELAESIASQTEQTQQLQDAFDEKEKELEEEGLASNADEAAIVAAADGDLAAMIAADTNAQGGDASGSGGTDGGMSAGMMTAAGAVAVGGIVAASGGDGGSSGGGNKAPEANPSRTVSTTEGEAVTFTVQATDPNDDVLTFTATAPGNGTVSISGGQVTYTPEAGFDGSDEFIITISDGKKSVNQTISVNVADGNDAPVVDPTQTVNVDEDGSVIFSVAATDPQGDSFTYSVSQLAASGTLSPTGNFGEFVYTPDGDFNGTDTVVISVTDSAGNVSTQTVTLNVASINDNPTVTTGPTATATTRGEAVTGSVEAEDVEGDVTYSLLDQPANGAVTLDAATGEYTYTPNSSTFTGADAFTIVATDADGATVNIVVPMVVGAEAIDKFNAELDADNPEMVNITGDQSVNIEMTNPANQIVGLDLDGDGVIDTDGVENNITGQPTGFSIINAYPGAPLDTGNDVDNFIGNLNVSGTGFQGDGVNTDGNIVLAGLGTNNIFTGIGNDFVALSNLAAGNSVVELGRNADFVHLSFSPNTALSGNTVFNLDGGETFDDDPSQDSDWLLVDATDDIETVVVNLTAGSVVTNGGGNADADEFEHFSGTGTLHGFLNGYDVNLGEADASGSPVNFTLGSTAQLDITGTNDDNNILLGGYDNDVIRGGVFTGGANDGGGDDILFGGDMQFLTRNQNNPNILLIPNDGRDELYGGAGNDWIMFEQDGGVIDGGDDSDTLFATDFTSGSEDGDLTSDGVVRIDLGAQSGFGGFAGYGGADVAGTADQTNYAAGGSRVEIDNMESVITTGMGGMDFDIDGGNSAEKSFDQMANYFGLEQNVDLRGTDGVNTLYANTGDDIIEGRMGNDNLSGGSGNDDFWFYLQDNQGDGVDVIHRQVDADGDNIWDGTFGQDFGLDSTTGVAQSRLIVDLLGTDLSLAQVAVTQVLVTLNGTQYDGGSAAELSAAQSADELAAILNTNLSAQDPDLSVAAVGNTITITSADGGTFDTGQPGTIVAGTATNGTLQTVITAQNDQPLVSQDRLIYGSYEDRVDGELVDDSSVLGSNISLGLDAYAEDLVADFGADGTRLAEDQSYVITFNNLTTEDVVTITVNGVEYGLQVGVDLDGNIINGEDTNAIGSGLPGAPANLAAIQAAFLARLADFIDSFGDDDTAAGSVDAANTATTITLSQNAYSGEETVFMRMPTVDVQNLSNGEAATAVVANTSDHEVHLLDFDGRDGGLNTDNVIFRGDENINRATFQTAKNSGETILGHEAILIDGGANTLVDTVSGQGQNSTTAADGAVIFDNTSTNANLAGADFAVHGDDQIFGGDGNDILSGGTGDDRFYASLGNDDIDGGSNYYAVQVLGEAEARVYVLNTWEAANITTAVPSLVGEVISSVTPIGDNETGTGLASGIFDDTLIAQQQDFTPGVTEFTITLNDYVVNGGIVALPNGGAGQLSVDVDGDGVAESVTDFTNFENIRTQSGIGKAVAGDGQGNDTLDVIAMSNVIGGAGGISYDLTNRAGFAGAVRTIEPGSVVDPTMPHPNFGMYDAPASFVINVDGVENVLTGTGDDLLTIDETEAAKNNLFSAGLGYDRIVYLNNYTNGGLFAAESLAQPTVDIIVNSANNTDQVVMTSGRNGQTVATDTLSSVERIALNGFTAQGSAEDDTIDVTNMTSGAVVDYTTGEVRDLGGNIQVVIENIVQMENVHADGDDTVIVADSSIMLTNATEDTATGVASRDLELASYFDYDEFDAAGMRIDFDNQNSGQISNAVNQRQFVFSLSETGTGMDTDILDYSAELGDIVSVVDFDPATPSNFVIVDGNSDGNLESAFDRVDQLIDVEGVVASSGVSTIDLTSLNEHVDLTYGTLASGVAVSTNIADVDTLQTEVLLENQNTSTPFSGFSYLEYYDNEDGDADVGESATWNNVQDGDMNLHVRLTDNQTADNHNVDFRGGNARLNYSALTRSLSLTLDLSQLEFDTALPGTTGLIGGMVTFTDGSGTTLLDPSLNPYMDTFTANSLQNVNNGGTFELNATQDAEDTFILGGGAGNSTFILGKVVGGEQIIELNNTGNTIKLTGFEFLQDNDGNNDIYVMTDLLQIRENLTLVDGPSLADNDTIKVGNDAIAFSYAPDGIVGVANTISLEDMKTLFNIDFDTMDITDVTAPNLQLVGSTNTNDQLLLDNLSLVDSIDQFESLIFNEDALAANGTNFVLDFDTNTITQGGASATFTGLLGTPGISVGGQNAFIIAPGVFEFGNNYDPVNQAVNIEVRGTVGTAVVGGNADDVLIGAGGNDILFGGLGADILDGGIQAEIHRYTLTGTNLEATTDLILGVGDPGAPGVLAEGAEFPAGADVDQIGSALANFDFSTINFDHDNDGTYDVLGSQIIDSISYDGTSNELTVVYNEGFRNLANDDLLELLIDTPDVSNAIDINGVTLDAANPIPAVVVTQGSNGGVDTFMYTDAAESTSIDTDTILNFGTEDGVDMGQLFNTNGVGPDNGFDDLAIDFYAASATMLADGDLFGGSDVIGYFDMGGTGDTFVFVDADESGVYDAGVDLMFVIDGVDAATTGNVTDAIFTYA